MAADVALLGRAAAEREPLLRWYGWAEAAVTFGYTQCWAEVANPWIDAAVTVVRRPTGGGLVDHRHDVTYALAIPACHPAAKARPLEAYRALHGTLAGVLRELGTTAALLDDCAARGDAACFARPSAFDVVDAATGRKIAGAAMKRTRDGLLIQGSVDRQAAPRVDFDARSWIEGCSMAIADWLGATAVFAETFSPENNPDWPATLARFQSADWNRRR